MLYLSDQIVQLVYYLVNLFAPFWKVCKPLLLSKYPHASLITSVSNAINASTVVYDKYEGKPPLYWLHSLLLCILAACGGGIIAGPLFGKAAGIIAYGDMLIPGCIFAWYTTHYLGLQKLYLAVPIKLVWYTFAVLYKVHSVIDMTNYAYKASHATIYYPTPFIGPVIAGTIVGCFGNFLPYDKGLSAIAGGTPWAIQSVFYTAFFYHAMVNDKDGIIGITLRAIFGTYSETTIKIIIAVIQLVAHYAKILIDYEINFFTPLHKLLYVIFQVTGPAAKKADDHHHSDPAVSERRLEILRILAVVAVVSCSIYATQPPSVLNSGEFLKTGESLGSCQFFSRLQNCQPRVLIFSKQANGTSSYLLSSYAGKGKSYTPSPYEQPSWSLPINVKAGVQLSSDSSEGLILNDDGVVKLVSRSPSVEEDILLWESSTKCPPAERVNPGDIYMSLDKNGQAIVHCANGTSVPLVTV